MKLVIPESSFGAYDIVYIDPPWPYHGSTTKNAAAGKHYDLMSMEEICDIPMVDLLRDKKHGAFFVWATCPRLHLALKAGEAWGLHYRGVAFNWIKTRKDGGIIGAQGVPPTSTKPTSELCLFFTTNKNGRPFKLLSSKVAQVILSPRGRHSEKPAMVRNSIVDLFGDRPRVEIFARDKFNGWDAIGNDKNLLKEDMKEPK